MNDKPQNQRNWNREEAIILVTFYFKNIINGVSRSDIEYEISDFLRKMAILNGESITDTFRNKAGISGQLSGLLASMEGKDSRVGSIIKTVGKEYEENSTRIYNEAEFILEKYAKLEYDAELANYDEQIDANSIIEGKEKERIVLARVNQAIYRNRLLMKYSSCLICGIKSSSLLVASHIKPWKASSPIERLDVNNGLLLCPNHDRLFDRGLISFDEKGKILISSQLSNDDAKVVGLEEKKHIILETAVMKYMEYHRNNVFMG